MDSSKVHDILAAIPGDRFISAEDVGSLVDDVPPETLHQLHKEGLLDYSYCQLGGHQWSNCYRRNYRGDHYLREDRGWQLADQDRRQRSLERSQDLKSRWVDRLIMLAVLVLTLIMTLSMLR